MTVMQSYYLPAGHATLQSWYVAYTRGIHGAKTYLNSTSWPDFRKAVSKYVYKDNALDLMPEVREAIRAGAQSGVMAPLKEQKLSVSDRLQGVSPEFQFPTLSNAPQQPAAAESEKPEQSVTVIPPVEAEIEHAKAFGAAIVDLRSDEQTWPADARRVAVVAAENPAPGVEVEPWKNPGSFVPADQRRDICEILQGMTPALTTTKYRYIKPVPQEAKHERLAAADYRRGIENDPDELMTEEMQSLLAGLPADSASTDSPQELIVSSATPPSTSSTQSGELISWTLSRLDREPRPQLAPGAEQQSGNWRRKANSRCIAA
ncbi:hypothetical protein EFK68_05025 [Pseudomonas aeruginosa]|nr:hypothetical protein EFK68_05025 [Pseudomonas aeruginosa]